MKDNRYSRQCGLCGNPFPTNNIDCDCCISCYVRENTGLLGRILGLKKIKQICFDAGYELGIKHGKNNVIHTKTE